MPPSSRVLILGGTGEAAALAKALAQHERIEATVSLAGRTAKPATLPGRVRMGGFGGIDGLMRYLRDERIDLVIDATHPFAAHMGNNAALAAAELRVPLLRLERPAWVRRRGDRWIDVDSVRTAARVTSDYGARVFLTVGRQELRPFEHAKDTWFLVRLVEAPAEPLPLERHEIILARGPFAEAEEEALMRAHAIDLVVAKNSGGEATYGKIAAARRLGLRVVMVHRPARPPNPLPAVATVRDALAWLGVHPG